MATVVTIGTLLCLYGAAPTRAAQTTALTVQVGSPARAVFGSDGREHVDYDLVISNAFTVPVTIDSVRVFDGKRPLLVLKGAALVEHTLAVAAPTATVPVSSFVKTVVDVVLPRSFGRRVPKRLTEQVRYALPHNAPVRAIIGGTIVRGPIVPIAHRAPIQIASPLYGAGWLDSSGCCDDPTSEHRTLLLPVDGSFRTPELFAIDWIREIHGSFYTGDGSEVTDWAGYGARLHAVADGVVVSVIKSRPEVRPFVTTDENPTVRRPQDFAGNEVVERIAPHQYAAYVHLQTGSVQVKAGQRLRTGQVIGRLGNTGNSTGPHLHFGIQDGPDILSSNSLPFEIRAFTVEGSARTGTTPGSVTVSGRAHRVRQAEPLIRSVFSF
jgi:hypothetical protein